jgi:hypothetical protein
MSVSTDLSPFAHDPSPRGDSDDIQADLFDIEATSSVEDYQLRATRRAQLEDADTLRRMRAL